MDEENNKALENAANAMEEAAEAPVETSAEEAPKEEAPAEETTVEAKADDVETKEEAVETPNEDAATEMKEEPAVEPAPTETAPVEPTPAPAEPVIEATSTPAPADSAKKSKKGLIIGVAAGVVVAGAAGGFGIAYALDSKPENVAVSAFADFLSAKTMATSGVIELALNNDSDLETNCAGNSTVNCIKQKENTIESVKVEINNDKNSSNETNTSATLKVVYGGEEISISLGSVVLKDYTIYAKIDGVKEAAKKALELAGSSELGDYAELYEDLIDAIASEIDGIWWKIYIPDVIDAIDEISASQKKQYKGIYQCAVEAADRAVKKQDKYVEFYKDNAFVTLEEYKGSGKPSAKGTPYKIKIDAKKFTAFANKASKEAVDNEYNDCMDKVYSSSYKRGDYEDEDSENTVPEIKEEDVKKALEDFPEIVVTIENGFFSHSLTGVYYADSNDSYSGKIDLKFSKEAKAVSAPSDTKNVTELYENIMNAYTEWQETAVCKTMKIQYPTYYNTYCDPSTNKPKPQYQTQLKRSTDDLSIFDLV